MPLREKTGRQPLRSRSFPHRKGRKFHGKYCIICAFMIYSFQQKTANKRCCQLTDMEFWNTGMPGGLPRGI